MRICLSKKLSGLQTNSRRKQEAPQLFVHERMKTFFEVLETLVLEPDRKRQPHGSGICLEQMPSMKTGEFLIQYSLERSYAVILTKIMINLQP